MKRYIITALLLLSLTGIQAQDYQTGVGIRGNIATGGFTIKHFTDEQTAVEGLLLFGGWGFTVTGLYEIHARAFEVDRLNWYYGGGAHIGQWGSAHPFLDKPGHYAVVGLDGIIGLEYTIEEIPFTLALDWKPSLNLIGNPGSLVPLGGFTVRYVF